MKKIVIAMLLLLPLIIVASVLLATSVISHEVYIAVEGVELNVDTGKTMEIGLSQRTFQLNATVYPTGARNREVEWSVENVLCFGDEIQNPVTIEDGLLTFSTYCAFDAVVTTVEGRKTARCNFYVKCDEMKGLSFTAPTTLEVGERAELSAVLDPVDAEVYDVLWESSDTTVLDVDGNGILKGLTPGTAVIKASAQGYEYERTVTVQPSVTKYGRAFSTAKNTLTFAELGVEEATALSGATVEGTTITLNADVAELTIAGETVSITRCEDGVRIKNGDLLVSRIYYVGKAPLYIEAEYADVFRTGKPDATVTATEGATVEDGVVSFDKKGAFTVTVNSNSLSQTLDFNAVQPVAYVRLSTVDADDKRGIAERTAYGTQIYTENGLDRYEVPLEIQYPNDADWEDFDLSVSDPDLLEITEDHVVVVKRNVTEPTEVTVSVTAHYSQFLSVPARANRHFTLIDGVNCFTYADVQKAAADERTIVLRNNVATSANDEFLTLKSDFYGNGYMLDFTATAKEAEQPAVHVVASDVLVTNAYIRCDDGAKINTANGLHGAALWIGTQGKTYLEDNPYIENVRIEYSIMENSYYCAASTRADVVFDGCIFRNASNFGIHVINDKKTAYIQSESRFEAYYVYSNVVVNNCIVSDVIAPAVGISTFANDGNNQPLATQSTFRQTGFFDVYNWQDVTSDSMLGRDFLPDNESANALFRSLITSFLGDELAKSKYDRVCYRTEENSFIHLGVITAGALNECTTVPTFEDERLKTFPLTTLDEFSDTAKVFIGHPLYRINLYLYEVDEEITPFSRFVADKVAFARLRGE